MIRRVRLHQWRSYEALDLALGPGTTFVVAPNGVGKTSLALGLAWAVFGDQAGIDARSCIRAGADGAEVEVELVLEDDREVVISRQIGHRGRPKVKGRLDSAEIDEATLIQLLEHSFGVDLGTAARLSLMLGGGNLASHKALDLKSHLHTAFGVAGLLASADLAVTVAKEAEKHRASVRASNQVRLADRGMLEAEALALQAQLSEHDAHREELQVQVRKADDARRRAEQILAYREHRQRFESEFGNLVEHARTILGGDYPDGGGYASWPDRIRSGREQAEREARESGEAYAEAKGAMAAAREALALLGGDAAWCPTCLRAIGSEELAAAMAQHESRLAAATDGAAHQMQIQGQHRSRSVALADLLSRLDSLHAPEPPPHVVEVADPNEIQATYASALETLEQYNQEIGQLRSRLQHLRSKVTADDQLAQTERELYMAYRREAITAAAAQAFRQTVAQITEELIEPIATEVKWRWKQLFSNDGLTLRPDGTIVRIQGGHELGWDTLSDGERIWARIVTHLLVLASSTRLPFAWFDEPLEHLDPELRHSVAATLASATKGGRPMQLLVTTYENGLARQLAEDTATASLVNIRSSGERDQPQRTPGDGVEPAGPMRRAS